MRRFIVPAAAVAALIAATSARADVAITVDKDAQQMTVAVDGQVRYHWPVSTGNPAYETPNGSYRAFRMEADHFSREFDDAPMPHSIFFTKKGHAIHGTFSEKSLGTPVSHGCVRLSRAHAATLYKLVEDEGVLKTTVRLTGSARVALARRNGQQRTAVARRDAAPDYDADGRPTTSSRAAPPRQIVPSLYAAPQFADDDDDDVAPPPAVANARPDMPRRYRQMREAQAYGNDAGDASHGYYSAPRLFAPSPGYYGGRGLFTPGW